MAVVIGCFAFGGILTWWSTANEAARQRGRKACEARARARSGALPLEYVSRDDAGKLREGVLVMHPDWIGFFPATETASDLIMPRDSVLSIAAVRDPRWVNRLLCIHYLTDRVEALVFHAGPDLSMYIGDAETAAELPRATARLKPPHDGG